MGDENSTPESEVSPGSVGQIQKKDNGIYVQNRIKPLLQRFSTSRPPSTNLIDRAIARIRGELGSKSVPSTSNQAEQQTSQQPLPPAGSKTSGNS